MKRNDIIKNEIGQYINLSKSQVLEKKFDFTFSSLEEIRVKLFDFAQVLEENEEQKFIIFSVRTGAFKSANVICSIAVNENGVDVTANAREGLIKQNLCEKAMKIIFRGIEK